MSEMSSTFEQKEPTLTIFFCELPGLTDGPYRSILLLVNSTGSRSNKLSFITI